MNFTPTTMNWWQLFYATHHILIFKAHENMCTLKEWTISLLLTHVWCLNGWFHRWFCLCGTVLDKQEVFQKSMSNKLVPNSHFSKCNCNIKIVHNVTSIPKSNIIPTSTLSQNVAFFWLGGFAIAMILFASNSQGENEWNYALEHASWDSVSYSGFEAMGSSFID